MDPHRLAEETSIVFHRAIVERLEEDPTLVERARERLQGWREAGTLHPDYAARWSALLHGPRNALHAALVDPTETGRALRQSSPFAGALDARERWRLWRETRQALRAAR